MRPVAARLARRVVIAWRVMSGPAAQLAEALPIGGVETVEQPAPAGPGRRCKNLVHDTAPIVWLARFHLLTHKRYVAPQPCHMADSAGRSHTGYSWGSWACAEK